MEKYITINHLLLKLETPIEVYIFLCIIFFLMFFMILIYHIFNVVKNKKNKIEEEKKFLSTNIKEQVLYAIGNDFIGVYIVDLNSNKPTIIKGSNEFLELLEQNNDDFFITLNKFFDTYAKQIYKKDFEKYIKKDYIIECASKCLTPKITYSLKNGLWYSMKVQRSTTYSKQTPEIIWTFELIDDNKLELKKQEIISYIINSLNFIMTVNLKNGRLEIIQSNGLSNFETITNYSEFITILENEYMKDKSTILLKQLDDVNEIINALILKEKFTFPYIHFIDNRWFRLNAYKNYDFSIENPNVIFVIDDISDAQCKDEEIRKMEEQMMLLRDKQVMNDRLLEILSSIVEFRSLESGEHIKRIEGFTKILATKFMNKYPEYKLNQKMIKMIVSASSLHDIGKIAVPDNILLKPGKLTHDEYEIMKIHTVKGGEIIKTLASVQDKDTSKLCYEIAMYHHERWDGLGYPMGLKENEIPISAQIVSIADVYDALVNKRCYKEAYSYEKAMNMIMNGECGVFNPQLLGCLALVKVEFELLAKGKIEFSENDKIEIIDSLNLEGKRILIVDDSRINIEIINNFIKSTNAETVFAYDGLEALDIVKSSTEGYFDLIITDIIMPKMNGHEEAKQIRLLNRDDLNKVPIIALSAEAYEETNLVYENKDIDLLLPKPITKIELYACLDKYLNTK